MEIQREEKDKKSRLYLFILIAILLAVNILLGVKLYMGNKENEQMSSQNIQINADNKDLVKELDALTTEYNSTKTENGELKTKMQEQDELINNKVAEIKKMIDRGNMSAAEIKKAKSELATLRAEINNYKTQIAELTQKNQELTNENSNLSTNLSNEQGKTGALTEQNAQLSQTVAVAKRLKAGSIRIAGLGDRILSSKMKETNKASKVLQLKVSLVLNENTVADAGSKNVYVKIISPDGAPMATDSKTIEVDGTQSLYTMMQTIDYKNEAEAVVLYWEKGSEFAKGEYTVEVFGDGYRMGQTKFTLK
ncbi:MAG: hypothetical protein H7321_06310 [Bacteroidia bacterium]|nr:hypothetical protein [Bacteroidia bacterium]